jgi:hypothetical protein
MANLPLAEHDNMVKTYPAGSSRRRYIRRRNT